MNIGQSEWTLPFNSWYIIILVLWVHAEHRLVLVPGRNPENTHHVPSNTKTHTHTHTSLTEARILGFH